jgi:hypothetical protein
MKDHPIGLWGAVNPGRQATKRRFTSGRSMCWSHEEPSRPYISTPDSLPSSHL